MDRQPSKTASARHLRRAGLVVLAAGILGIHGIAQETHQSSTFEQATADLALDAVTDGNYDNGSVAMTHRDPYAYWWADLGTPTAISAVTVHGRTDSHPERLDRFVLVAIPDGPSPATDPLLSTLDRQQLADPGFSRDSWLIHRSFHGFTAEAASELVTVGGTYRYLYLLLPRADYLQLAEVEIHPG